MFTFSASSLSNFLVGSTALRSKLALCGKKTRTYVENIREVRRVICML